MEQLRIAVRTLVEFTLHGEDIRPVSLRAMQEGVLGHKARQASLEAGWQTEVPLELAIPVDEETELLLSGRMDAFAEGAPPQIEEIKLWSYREPPVQPDPAHTAQAVCYAHMLCCERDIDRVSICVTYVNRGGQIRARFPEELTADEAAARFQALLEPYLRRLRIVRAHERARDASLRGLAFPFPAYRAGQRDMAVQVYTAVRLGKRLFASMPTGTGKSIAALFPALKAMGEGRTGRIYYLTARTTQRQGAREAVEQLRRQPLTLWTLTLDAKDKQCPRRTLCHPDYCERAKGHYLRDTEAVTELLAEQDWSPQRIRETADRHCLCPFELSLSLAELADLTICDYNYALDPAVHIQRIFDRTSDVTLLIDEAHHLLERLRDMLSGHVDAAELKQLRRVVSRHHKRSHPLYKAMTAVLRALEDLPTEEGAAEGSLTHVPQSLELAAMQLAEAFQASVYDRIPWDEADVSMQEVLSGLNGFIRALHRDEPCAWLWQGRKDRRTTALALDVGSYFDEVTCRLSGVVCFSATMHPLQEMKRLLGGSEEDACFAMPSPFDPQRLLVLQQDVNTRYASRPDACEDIRRAILQVVQAKPGRYMVFFPSFAFMRQVSEGLDWPHQLQRQGMSDEERAAFLAPYVSGGEPMLSLCVLGGVFSEGIDLPGDALDGVVVVGVGLPQVNLFQETLRAWYQEQLGRGFFYAYQLPGMQKVAQAVGRVIRTEHDVGVALLLDDRYRQEQYRALCPPHWQMASGPVPQQLQRFWQRMDDRA